MFKSSWHKPKARVEPGLAELHPARGGGIRRLHLLIADGDAVSAAGKEMALIVHLRPLHGGSEQKIYDLTGRRLRTAPQKGVYIQGKKKILSSQLIQGQAEIMEVIASSHMEFVGIPLRELDLPKSVIIAAIHRGNDVIIPDGNTIIKENDRVIMLGLISDISSIEKLLKDNRKLHLLFGR